MLKDIITELNFIADVISGQKKLFVIVYPSPENTKSYSKEIGISDISSYYKREDCSCAFYITSHSKQEFDAMEILDDDTYWLGDFDSPGGGAGNVLFTLAGRRIN